MSQIILEDAVYINVLYKKCKGCKEQIYVEPNDVYGGLGKGEGGEDGFHYNE